MAAPLTVDKSRPAGFLARDRGKGAASRHPTRKRTRGGGRPVEEGENQGQQHPRASALFDCAASTPVPTRRRAHIRGKRSTEEVGAASGRGRGQRCP